jgi:4-carboxymuconolactone decarboxylase
VAEVFFQLATYAGMPAVNEALDVYREVLKERGNWPIQV